MMEWQERGSEYMRIDKCPPSFDDTPRENRRVIMNFVSETNFRKLFRTKFFQKLEFLSSLCHTRIKTTVKWSSAGFTILQKTNYSSNFRCHVTSAYVTYASHICNVSSPFSSQLAHRRMPRSVVRMQQSREYIRLFLTLA